MNELELGVLIEQALGEIKDREVQSIEAGEQPDGTYAIVLKIDNRIFNIIIEEEK